MTSEQGKSWRRFGGRKTLIALVALYLLVWWIKVGQPRLQSHLTELKFENVSKQLKPGITQDELISLLTSNGLNSIEPPITEWTGEWGFFIRNGEWVGVLTYHFDRATYFVRYFYPKNTAWPQGPLERFEIYRTGTMNLSAAERQHVTFGNGAEVSGTPVTLLYSVQQTESASN